MKKQQRKSLKSSRKNTKTKLLIFLVKLFLLSIPIVFIVDLNMYYLQKFIAVIVNYLFNLFGISSVVFDTMSTGLIIAPALYLADSGLVVVIDAACSGVRSFYLLFALLFSLNWNPKKQMKYLFLGGLILFLVNIFRIFIVTLLVINFNLPGLFENLLWTTMLNVTVFVILIYYLKT